MDTPETRYAKSDGLQIAYQTVGDGPLDIVFVSAYLSNIEMFWEIPAFSRLFERLASFSRLILIERRGSGMSDGIAGEGVLDRRSGDNALDPAEVRRRGGRVGRLQGASARRKFR